MKTATAVLAVATFWLVAAVSVVVFMLGDDSPACGPTPGGKAGTPSPSGTKRWPMVTGTYEISDYFGTRGGAHRGVDFAAPEGTPIYAVADGVVTDAGPATGFGSWIVISHNVDGEMWSSVYGHMWPQGIDVAVNAHVSAGQPIAKVGNAGDTSGPHLHHEIWQGSRADGVAIDPLGWLEGAGEPGSGSGTTTSAPTTGPAAPVAETTPTPTSTPARPDNCAPTGGGGVDNLAPDKVPAELEPWYRKAGTLCPQISSAMLASQGSHESSFNAQALSPDGAMGVAQFMPGTWPTWAGDDDGNGTASAWDVGDAIMGQGRFMCAIATDVDEWIAEGIVTAPNGREELYLAGYNAGPDAVRRSGGFPTGSSDYINQTRPYVDNILADVPHYTNTLS